MKKMIYQDIWWPWQQIYDDRRRREGFLQGDCASLLAALETAQTTYLRRMAYGNFGECFHWIEEAERQILEKELEGERELFLIEEGEHLCFAWMDDRGIQDGEQFFFGQKDEVGKPKDIHVQRKFRNLTSDYTESCCWRSVSQEMWSRRRDTAEMRDMRIWRVGSARNAVFFHSFVASLAGKFSS